MAASPADSASAPALAAGPGVGRALAAWWAPAAAIAALLALTVVLPRALPPPERVDFDGGLTANGAPLPPSWQAPLGTDELGRDVLARTCAGLRLSLLTSGLATALAMILAVIIGVALASLRRRASLLGAALQRVVDVVMALPVLLFAMLGVVAVRAADSDAAAHDPTRATLIAATALGLWVWCNPARIIAARAEVLLDTEMTMAARALGVGRWRLLWRHLLPNLRPLVTPLAVMLFAQVALADAALSFLGLGPPPPAASLGRMVLDGRPFFRVAPWLIVAPGVALIFLVTTFHVLATQLRRGAGDRP